MEMVRRAEKIQGILDRTLQQLGLAERMKEADVVRRFSEIVGGNIAKRAEAVSIRDGKLVVKVSSPVWRQELSFSKKEIIEALNRVLGDNVVKDIHFSG
jgi:predicted nucleic acid-binding Zn ribbon protein